MQRASACWFALASLLWCVSGPSGGVLFTAAPIQRSKSKHGGLVSGAAALGQRRYRHLTERRVLAQLVEYEVPPGMESKLPVTVPDAPPAVQEKVVLAQLLEYQPPAGMEMEAASSDGSGDGTVVALVAILIAFVCATVYGLATKDKSDEAAAAPTPAQPATATPATAQSTPPPASTATSTPETEPLFATGQRVSLLGPPKMVGKVGSIVDFIGASTVAVQLESGSIFHFAMENIQHAAAVTALPTQAAEDGEFTPGQHVTLLHPPALAGKTGSIFSHAGDEIYAVVMASGSIFHFPARNLQDATPVRAF